MKYIIRLSVIDYSNVISSKISRFTAFMIILAIEDLNVHLDNTNLLLSKSAIQFKPLAQKTKSDK